MSELQIRLRTVKRMDITRDLNPPLSTSRLRLEPQVAEHAAVMVQVLADPRMHIYIPTEPPGNETALRERYARLESRHSPDHTEGWLNWTIFRGERAQGTVQASVQLAASTADVAYLLHPEAWGQEYAGEAVLKVLSYLQITLGVQCVRAKIDTRNRSSQRLAERLRFVRTGEILGADTFKGASSDEFVYELELKSTEDDSFT